MADDEFQSTQFDKFESTEDDQWSPVSGVPPSGGFAQVGPLRISAEISGGVVSGYRLGNVNQRQSLGITFSWTDLDGNEVLVSGWYYIIDVDSGEKIREKEPVFQQPNLPIFLYPQDNEMRASTKATERRAILLCLTYGAQEQATARYEFTLANLGFQAEDFE